MTHRTSLRGAIIGCGLIGRKRAAALDGTITVCCDVQEARAEQLARDFPGVRPTTDWQAAVRRDDIDFIVAATTHDMLAPVAVAAASAGKHVLVEKPGARSAAELDAVAEAARRTGALVRVGFNHRYHRAFRKAREIFDSGALGEMMFIRGRYGHGGRPGYDKEWRAVPERSGGGELIDQGAHLIDLARWFLGDFTGVQGRAPTYFWNMPVEDNGFLLLETPRGQIAFLHASWTEWKNLFSFEIAGRVGKLEIGGLGGSYGLERLTWYRMSPEMGPPETMAWEYPMADDSWDAECAAFLEDIRLRRQPQPGIADAQAALRIIERIYCQQTPPRQTPSQQTPRESQA
ncbi:MAG TPA: Gfo/Idh/MocA family oxidoreductase [Candidatus Acidoferrales bacterium]|nr:Gfo/Idh/MocA family oxidoreductase [Candidatus Acidoferrales bacterium]